MKKRGFARFVAAFLSAVVCICIMFSDRSVMTPAADTQSELEAKQEELKKKRADVEALIAQYANDADQTEKYLEEYDNKMAIQEEQIANIEEQIEFFEDATEKLAEEISLKETEVEEGVELFRKRLRAIYISGNDSYASVLTGASSFYDILVRMELMQRVARHDNEVIEELNSSIASLNASKTEYAENISELETKKQEEKVLYEELRDTYNNHAETKAMQEAKIADYNQRYDEIVAEESRVEEELQAEIRRKQEEAERKRKEEEERRKREEEQKRLEAEANGEVYIEQDISSFTSYSETGFIWPVPTIRNISSTDNYGERYIQEEGRYDFHKGIDITKPGCYGEAIVASAAGEVITAGDTGNGYGYHVVIDHGNSIATLYGHCSKLAVKAGDIVEQGQVIGYIGSTGYAYGNHLHFEVRINGQHTDPNKYVNVNN